jgi:glycosyltransferase involved in cell wall biosynthesis
MNVHFEVSSPDVVDRCLKINKRIILPLFASLNCVSPSVLKRFQKEYSGNNLMSAPSTFYCIKEISMDVIMEKENIIVYGSRFLPRKNPVLFALVVNEILIKYNDWKVFVMGNGDLEDQVTNILRVHIAEGRAVVGRVVDLFELLKKSKIYVSIIEPDNYPSQSILEAMNAYNSLLISNNGDSYRFIDKSNLNGELVNLNFVEIFQGLERLISLPHDTQQRVCLNSYFYLKKSFSSSQYLDYLYKLYKHQ